MKLFQCLLDKEARNESINYNQEEEEEENLPKKQQKIRFLSSKQPLQHDPESVPRLFKKRCDFSASGSKNWIFGGVKSKSSTEKGTRQRFEGDYAE